MHNAAYRELGLDWVYIPLPLADEADLLRFLGAARVLPFVGFNVTMPFKQIMLSMCDEVAMMATMAGAVNAVHCVDGRFVGYNTDGRGFVEALAAEASFDPAGKRVAIIGAGGAAGAALVSLIVAKAGSVTVAARSLDAAEELVARVESHARVTQLEVIELAGAEEAVSSADLIVNATPLGMHDQDSSPVPALWLKSGQTVFDMVYGGPATALVREARDAGATAVDGLGMLVAQGAISVDIWSESAQISAPRPVMRAAAEEQLRAIQAGEMWGMS